MTPIPHCTHNAGVEMVEIECIEGGYWAVFIGDWEEEGNELDEDDEDCSAIRGAFLHALRGLLCKVKYW
jgi:hypothetical protein